MLKQNQICAIRKFMFLKKKSITELAKELDISRSYLSMILNGTMNSKTIEDKVVNWYKTEKDKE
jgi:transcriptional regulator with XRE-family HTH domain